MEVTNKCATQNLQKGNPTHETIKGLTSTNNNRSGVVWQQGTTGLWEGCPKMVYYITMEVCPALPIYEARFIRI